MFDWLKTGKTTQPRKGMPSPELDEAEFKRRFLAQFQDPGFEPLATELVRVSSAAWDAYINSRKAPRTRKAPALVITTRIMSLRSTGSRLQGR
jgi:hypothetical protein